MGIVYDQVCMFKAKYPATISWFRTRKHAKVVEKHLNENEKVLYSFVGQKNDSILDIFSTSVFCMTNERLLIGQDHILTGYTFSSITPDMFNDMQVYSGILFGKLTIDTVKEVLVITNLDKKCLAEVETAISKNMMEAKKKYALKNQL